jgi:polar amino acid transport system substrate-binding protein
MVGLSPGLIRTMNAVLLAAAFLLSCLAFSASSRAQSVPSQPDSVPFFDLSRKPERPDLSGLRAIRFLTDDDYPPFHFPGPDGQLSGFNVDLARAICLELKVACTIQARRWDTLLSSLEEGRGDAVIASMADSDEARTKADFGIAYYRSPGRFVTRKDKGLVDGTAAVIVDKAVAVVAGSSHAAFVTTFFPKARQVIVPDREEALKLVSSGAVDAMFGDGVGLALWLNGQTGMDCCRFAGGAFFESRYFGTGAAIAFRKDGAQLRRAVDFALFRLAEQGIYQNLMLKYFPVSFY